MKFNKPKSDKESPPNASEETDKHLSGWPLALLLFGLFLTVLVVTLDISIVAVAIPRITDEFNSIKDIAWYASSFLITQCTLVPLAGRLYTYFPFKACFLSCLLVFEIGSAVCGAAPSSTALIIGRAICGIGSSGLINGALAIVSIATPPGKKALAMGLFMAVASCGQVIGPLIGGGLTEHVSWRWCFYINLPVGAASSLLFIFVTLPPSDKKSWTSKTLLWDLDIPGFIIFAPASIMLLLALNWGGVDYAWSSATIIGMLCGAAVIFVIFVCWEIRQQDQAMIPPPFLKKRGVFAACITTFFAGGYMMILVYYIVLWFQVIKTATPSESGVYTLPSFISQVLFAILTGATMQKLGYAIVPMMVGGALGVISFGLMSTFSPSTSTGEWIGYQIIAGAGRGMAFQMPVLVAQSAVAKADNASATSVIVWCQFLGGAIFLSIGQVIFTSLLRTAIRDAAPSLDASAAIDGGATNFLASVPEGLRGDVLGAYNKAITQTFYLGLALAAVCMLTSLGVWTVKVETGLGKKTEDKSEQVETGVDSETDNNNHEQIAQAGKKENM